PTWIDGPCGMEARPNYARFAWEDGGSCPAATPPQQATPPQETPPPSSALTPPLVPPTALAPALPQPPRQPSASTEAPRVSTTGLGPTATPTETSLPSP